MDDARTASSALWHEVDDPAAELCFGTDEVIRRAGGLAPKERARLARDMHDQTGQHLACLKLALDRVRKRCGARVRTADIDGALALVELIEEDLRRVLVGLHAPSLEASLDVALRELVADWSAATAIAARVKILGRTVQTAADSALYRIVQEALTNVAKHAATASLVAVTVRYGRDRVTLRIRDDGPGFCKAEILRSGGRPRFGLSGMRERAALAGFRIAIRTSPGAGTLIVAHVVRGRAGAEIS